MQQEKIDEAVRDYEKTEIVRQAVDSIKRNARKMDEKRRSRDLAYSGTKSRIHQNMKSIERAKTAGNSPVRHFPEQSLIENLALEKSIEVTDVSVTLKGTISPVRLQKDP